LKKKSINVLKTVKENNRINKNLAKSNWQ